MDTKKINIQAELKTRKITQTKLAKKLKCSLPFLNQVITGIRTSKRIRGGIAAYIDKPVSEIWPDEKQEKAA